MKLTTTLLLLLSASLVCAQRGDDRAGSRSRVEGVYDLVQRDGTIHRTLRLDRDGTVEITTEMRDVPGSRRDARAWSRDDTRRYGRVGDEVSRGRPVKHLGKWFRRDNDILVRLDPLRLGDMTRSRFEMTFTVLPDELTLDKATELYGESKLSFRRLGGSDNGRPSRSRFGSLYYDRDLLTIESVDLVDGRNGDARLKIRAGSRSIELRGDMVRRGDEVTFRLPDSMGEYRLTLRDGRVDTIRGAGSLDRHRIQIDESSRP